MSVTVSEIMSEIAGERVPHTVPDNHMQFNEIASLHPDSSAPKTSKSLMHLPLVITAAAADRMRF